MQLKPKVLMKRVWIGEYEQDTRKLKRSINT